MEPVLRFRRLLQAPTPPVATERCKFCGLAVGQKHSHVIDREKRALLCVCRACYLLFTSAGAAQGKFRAVSERYVHAPESVLSAAQWDEFEIPVGIAFFFYNSNQNRVVALYPSPAGATEAAIPPTAWQEVVKANPEDDEEALCAWRFPARSWKLRQKPTARPLSMWPACAAV